MVEYILVCAYFKLSFIKDVNAKLSQGYELVAGPFIDEEGATDHICQAMVKRDKSE